jgi:DNA-binding protein WhiA
MLSEAVRDELAAIAPRRECCRLAELSALFHTAGSFHLRGGGRVAAHLDLVSNAVARRTFTLLRGFGVGAEIRTYRRHAFDRATRYQLHVEGDGRALDVLRRAGVAARGLAPLALPPRRVVARSCSRAAYLPGAILGAGSVSGPRSPHLEIRTATREGAAFLAAAAAREHVELRVLERRGHAAAYAKSVETIGDLLALAGASDAALGLDEHAVVAGARSAANRLANADHANLVRSSRAARDQLRAVRLLAADGRLDRLPPAVREIAELRLRHPTLSLRELAAKCRPPATKAAAHRRLRRLVRLAEDEPQGRPQTPVSTLQTR